MDKLTKNQTAARIAENLANSLSSTKLRAMILDIHAMLDSEGEWDSETTSNVAQCLTDAGFVIRDPNDVDAFDSDEGREIREPAGDEDD
jgi:uncharacterized protein YjgD (DUF1641 family)